jgi:hypothetical protein
MYAVATRDRRVAFDSIVLPDSFSLLRSTGAIMKKDKRKNCSTACPELAEGEATNADCANNALKR